MRPAPPRLSISLPRLSRSTTIVVVLCIVSAVVTYRATTGAAAESAALGTRIAVVVVTEDIAAGAPLDATNATMATRPARFVPDRRVSSIDGAIARVDLSPGEVVVDHHVAVGVSGPAALLPEGWRGLAVPIYDAAPPLRPGDAVDVYASVDGGRAGLVVDRGIVIAVDDQTVTLAVPGERVSALAFALTNAAVTLALRT